MHFSQITKQSLATNRNKLRGIFKINTLILFSNFEPNTTKNVEQILHNYS